MRHAVRGRVDQLVKQTVVVLVVVVGMFELWRSQEVRSGGAGGSPPSRRQ
jgi:hypothetical protein